MLDDLALLKPHYAACKHVADWVQKTQAPTVRDVWNDVFCGGEGLYWSFQNAQNRPDTRGYRDAIRVIENEFSSNRATYFASQTNIVDDVYRSFASKAFQTGYVMAVDYLAKNGDGDRIAAASDLINELNTYKVGHWVAIFQELRPWFLTGGVDPKSWPAYRTLLVRMYDGKKGEIFGTSVLQTSPDWMVYKNLLQRTGNGYIAANPDDMPDVIEIERQVRTELDRVGVILANCKLDGTSWFDHDDMLQEGIKYMTKMFDAYYQP